LFGDSGFVGLNRHCDQRDVHDTVYEAGLRSLTRETQSSNITCFSRGSDSTTKSSISQKSFDGLVSTSREVWQAPNHTTSSTSEPWTTNNSATLLGQPNEGFTVSCQTSVPPIDQSTTTKSAKLPHPPRNCSSSSLENQRLQTTPDQAQKALQIVIGYCKRQPRGYLETDEGVLLGTLAQRLRHSCE
jgi:hypothetical protein